MKRRWILFAPLAIVSLLFGMFIYRLATPESKLIESRWIDQPMPLFDLPPATAGVAGLKSSDLADGRPRLVNIFASWCIPCKAEAPQLDALARAGVPIDGIAIRDRPEDVAAFLAETGNPFQRIGADMQSSVQIALGSSGVPETFLVDGKGIIREQIQGIITPEMVPEIQRKLGGDAVMRVLALLLTALLAAPLTAQDRLPPAPLAYKQLDDPAQEAKAKALMDELRCLVCQGQSIADSDAPLAGDMRHEVRSKIAAGESTEAIRDWLIARYGNWVTYNPPFAGATWFLWIGPLLFLAAGLWLARGRFRKNGDSGEGRS